MLAILTVALILPGGGRTVLSGPEETVATADGHALLHYTRSGIDAVDPRDDDGDGIPDAVAWAEEGLAVTWAAFVDDDGWPAPPSDAGLGGDDRLDVYLRVIDGNGFAHVEGGAGCWIELDPGVAAGFGAATFASVAGHELHHCLQFGVSTTLEGWIYEATSTYAQYLLFHDDQALELARDALWQIRLGDSERALDDEQGTFEYAGMVWVKYLVDRGGGDRTAVLTLWEAMAAAGGWEAGHDQALPATFGVASLDDAAAEHAVWNWFACDRDDGRHYADDAVTCRSQLGVGGAEVEALPAGDAGDLLGRRGADYVELVPDCATGELAIEVTATGRVRAQLIEVAAGAASDVSAASLVDGETVTLTAAAWNLRHRVVLAVTALDEGATFTWSASASGTYAPPASPPPLATLTIDPGAALALAVGEHVTLRALAGYGTCQDGADLTAEVAWTSSDDDVVTVRDGELVAVGAGAAEVVATQDGVTSPPVLVTVDDLAGGCGCTSADLELGLTPTLALLILLRRRRRRISR